ncbi:MAG: twin-arginine translocase TatA/TatE family subunit [Myxococcaceae bacterium]|jgi:sec-independent protein translocase protein TatB|nr:twin-arginine translocase TatA/TatE family subunit [Myxococcaceae bacterium]
MLNIGTGEIILIAVAALLILGPSKLPEFARGIGKLVREFRRQTDDVRNVVEREFYKMDQDLTAHESPPVLPQPAPDVVAHGEPFEHDALAHQAHDALPPGTDDASQVMKGAPAGEPLPSASVTDPTTVAATPEPASHAVSAGPEKATS